MHWGVLRHARCKAFHHSVPAGTKERAKSRSRVTLHFFHFFFFLVQDETKIQRCVQNPRRQTARLRPLSHRSGVGLIMNKWACFVGEAPRALSDGGNPCLQVLNDEGWCNTSHRHGYHRIPPPPTHTHPHSPSLPPSGCSDKERASRMVCCYADFALS